MSQNQCHFHTLSGLAEEVEENVAGKTVLIISKYQKKDLIIFVGFFLFLNCHVFTSPHCCLSGKDPGQRTQTS